MVYNTNITAITSNTTLSISQDVYLVDASGNNITITLPNITADGIHYTLQRIDTSSNNVTIAGFNSFQTISGNVSVPLLQNNTIRIQSYSDLWYLTQNTPVTGSQSRSLFNSAFVQNNGNPFITFSGTGSAQVVCYFYYAGLTATPITNIITILSADGGNPNGNARIRDFTNGGAIISTIPYNLSSGTPVRLSSSSISNLPVGPTVLQLDVTHSGNNNKLNVYSLTLQ